MMKHIYKHAWRVARLQWKYGYSAKGQSGIERIAMSHLRARGRCDVYASGLTFIRSPQGNVTQWGGVRNPAWKYDEIPF